MIRRITVVLAFLCALMGSSTLAADGETVAADVARLLQGPPPAGLEELRDYDLLAGALRQLYGGRDHQPL